jgi:ATP-binding cassette subfamily B protein
MRALLAESKAFKSLIAAALLFNILGSLADLWMPNLMSDIINLGVLPGNIHYILHTGALMLGVCAVSIVCALATGFFSARFSAGLSQNLREKVFTKVTSFSLAEFDRFGTSSLITRTVNDIAQINNFASVILRIVVTAPIMSLGGLAMAYSKSASLSRVFLLALFVIGGVVTLVAKLSVPLSRRMQQKIDAVNRVMREKLTGVRVIRAFGTQAYERRRFDAANRDLTDNAIGMQRTVGLLFPVAMLTMNLTSVAIVWLGGIQASQGGVLVGDIMALIQYVSMVLRSTLMLSGIFVMLPRASASAERIQEVLQTEPVVGDPLHGSMPQNPQGIVRFEDVSFFYPGAELAAVSHLSFTARPGQITAVVGGTGSGKTTLLNLTARLYDVSDGAVSIDGIDVRAYKQQSLRARIGYVPQKAVLFTGSVSDNIRYGREDATDGEIIRAAEISQADDFISAQPEGYSHSISQGGVNLSGGQKQRLAIARAVIRDPDIYLFDDSFSALDFQTDANLRRALAARTASATVIIVAQRISTVMGADQIVVMEDGRAVGIGTHKELMQNCSVYREIVSSQLSAEEGDYE